MHPASKQVWKVIDTYLALAYPGLPPSAVRSRLETLHSLSDADFFDSPIFEKDAPVHPTRYSLRLGNHFYPHMKLRIERSPDKHSFLFKADTHDKHICPAAGSREFDAFKQLMEHNEKLAQTIEAKWAEEGMPTFKTYLRDDLARRQAAKAEGA